MTDFDIAGDAYRLLAERTPFRLKLSHHSQFHERAAWYLLAPKDSPIRFELETNWLQIAEPVECDFWQCNMALAMLEAEIGPPGEPSENEAALYDEIQRMFSEIAKENHAGPQV